MRNVSTLAGLAVLLAACNQQTATPPASPPPPAATPAATAPQAAPTLTGFTHVKGEDLFGYFMPTEDVKIGVYVLENLSIGPEEEFAKWEAGERMATYAPVMLEFSDVTSPQATNELGQTYYTRTIRVLPKAYLVGDGKLKFVGVDPVLGEIEVEGTFDLPKLRANQAAGPNGSDEVVLSTVTRIGAQVFKTLTFSWFGGD